MNYRYTLLAVLSCSPLVASNLWKELPNTNFFKQLCIGPNRDRQTCDQLEKFYAAFEEAGTSAKESFRQNPLQKQPITLENADKVVQADLEILRTTLEKMYLILQNKNVNIQSLMETIAQKYNRQEEAFEEVMAFNNAALLKSIASTNREWAYIQILLEMMTMQAMQAMQAMQEQQASAQAASQGRSNRSHGSPTKQRSVKLNGNSSGRSMFDVM